jgi:glycine betaine/choline ABC-type transport system substrate-binding protein
VARAAVLDRHPAVRRALAELAGEIDDAEMRRLNARADVQREDIRAIARDWLTRVVP